MHVVFVLMICQSTKTTITDCQAVLEDISGRNGIITVAPGFCLNWWEGTCLARICGKDRVFSANSDSLVEKMRSLILGPCIAKGETGVVADTPSWNSTAGTYRLFLETYVGI